MRGSEIFRLRRFLRKLLRWPKIRDFAGFVILLSAFTAKTGICMICMICAE